MSPERQISPDDPHSNSILFARDTKEALRAWSRLATCVLTDVIHETGVYDEMSRKLRKQVDRRLQIAIDPETPRTRAEVQKSQWHYEPGFPIWSIPILLGVAAVSPLLDGAEKYSQSDKIGSGALARKFDAYKRKLNLDDLVNEVDAKHGVLRSSLYPQLNAAMGANRISTEPANFVINIDQLLEATEATVHQDGSNEHFAKMKTLDIFANKALRPISLQDQRARAAEIFMGSDVLQNGELYQIDYERRSDLLPDGPRTFRIETTIPYQQAWANDHLTPQHYERLRPWFAKKPIDPHPIDELLIESRV